MSWDHLRVFIEIARLGQMLAVARKLGLDDATVSRRLSSLEKDLGSTLFLRGPSGCVLTEAGEQLLVIAERIEAEMLRIPTLLGGQDGSVNGVVRVGATDAFGTYFLAPELATMALENPALRLQILPLAQVFSLSKREVDIAVTLSRPTDPRMLCQRLIDYRLRLYVASGPRNGKAPERMTVKDLRSEVLVTNVDALIDPVNDFKELTPLFASRYECGHLSAQVETVRSGIGVGIFPLYVGSRFPDLRGVVPSIYVDRRYWLVSHADLKGVGRVTAVRNAILDRTKRAAHLFRDVEKARA